MQVEDSREPPYIYIPGISPGSDLSCIRASLYSLCWFHIPLVYSLSLGSDWDPGAATFHNSNVYVDFNQGLRL